MLLFSFLIFCVWFKPLCCVLPCLFGSEKQVSLEIFVFVDHSFVQQSKAKQNEEALFKQSIQRHSFKIVLPFTVCRTRDSVLGPLRQTLAECFGPRPLCTGQSSVHASHPQRSIPPPSAWQSWRPCFLTPGCGACLDECLGGSSWAVAWAAWQGPANSPAMQDLTVSAHVQRWACVVVRWQKSMWRSCRMRTVRSWTDQWSCVVLVEEEGGQEETGIEDGCWRGLLMLEGAAECHSQRVSYWCWRRRAQDVLPLGQSPCPILGVHQVQGAMASSPR